MAVGGPHISVVGGPRARRLTICGLGVASCPPYVACPQGSRQRGEGAPPPRSPCPGPRVWQAGPPAPELTFPGAQVSRGRTAASDTRHYPGLQEPQTQRPTGLGLGRGPRRCGRRGGSRWVSSHLRGGTEGPEATPRGPGQAERRGRERAPILRRYCTCSAWPGCKPRVLMAEGTSQAPRPSRHQKQRPPCHRRPRVPRAHVQGLTPCERGPVRK